MKTDIEEVLPAKQNCKGTSGITNATEDPSNSNFTEGPSELSDDSAT